jgi:hypothetical protein
MKWRYDHAGLGLTLMGGALVIGILEGITGLHLQPLVWAIPVGIVALIMGGMAFVFPPLIAAFVVTSAVEKAKGYSETTRPGLPPHNWRATWVTPPGPRDCRNCGTPWNSVPFRKGGICQDRRACAGRLATYGWVGE